MTTAITVWLQHENNITVLIYTDNKNIVDIWFSGSTQSVHTNDGHHTIIFFTATRNIDIKLQHVYGYNNTAADLLSRLQVPKFRRQFTGADEEMSAIPANIWDICK